MANNRTDHEFASSILIAATYAAAGGALPTLCRLAPIGLDGDVEGLLRLGHLAALLIYSLVGFVVCLGFRELKYKQAFILGIAAPGLITNILAGAGDADRQSFTSVPKISIFASAHAATKEDARSNEFWLDLKRGLGFSVPTSPKSMVDEMSFTSSDGPTESPAIEADESVGVGLDDSQESRDEPVFFESYLANQTAYSDHPAFSGFNGRGAIDILVRHNYPRSRYLTDDGAGLGVVGSNDVSLSSLLKPVPPELICSFDQAANFRSEALAAFALLSEDYPPFSLLPIIDIVADESGFRSRLAGSLGDLGVEDLVDSSSCEKTANFYAQTTKQLYYMAIDQIHR